MQAEFWLVAQLPTNGWYWWHHDIHSRHHNPTPPPTWPLPRGT